VQQVDHASHAAGGYWSYVLALGAVGASWVQSNAAGALVTTITVVVGGAVAAYCLVVERLKASADRRWLAHQLAEHHARLDMARVAAEIRVIDARAELDIQADREQASQDSIAGQLARLQETADQAARRVEDANNKLHEQLAQANALKVQLEFTNVQLQDATAELQTVRDELSRERTAKGLLAEQLDRLEGSVKANSESIGLLSGSAEFPAQPPAEPRP
jgi:uncharacterized phage infection (PIP) family protein YhgE